MRQGGETCLKDAELGPRASPSFGFSALLDSVQRGVTASSRSIMLLKHRGGSSLGGGSLLSQGSPTTQDIWGQWRGSGSRAGSKVRS